MKGLPGTPGTFSGLALRVLQLTLATGSIAAVASAKGFEAYTAYCYLIASMGLQVFWSLLLASMDIFALAKKTDLYHPTLVGLFTAGDWVTATLSLSGVCAAAGITVLFERDLGYCNTECRYLQMSIALGFMSWLLAGLSSLIMFWILATDSKLYAIYIAHFMHTKWQGNQYLKGSTNVSDKIIKLKKYILN